MRTGVTYVWPVSAMRQWFWTVPNGSERYCELHLYGCYKFHWMTSIVSNARGYFRFERRWCTENSKKKVLIQNRMWKAPPNSAFNMRAEKKCKFVTLILQKLNIGLQFSLQRTRSTRVMSVLRSDWNTVNTLAPDKHRLEYIRRANCLHFGKTFNIEIQLGFAGCTRRIPARQGISELESFAGFRHSHTPSLPCDSTTFKYVE